MVSTGLSSGEVIRFPKFGTCVGARSFIRLDRPRPEVIKKVDSLLYVNTRPCTYSMHITSTRNDKRLFCAVFHTFIYLYIYDFTSPLFLSHSVPLSFSPRPICNPSEHTPCTHPNSIPTVKSSAIWLAAFVSCNLTTTLLFT